jgi:signal transduction histidine kinase
VPVLVSARGESSRLDPDIELAAFRTAQEAVTNALKYASATKITIRIRQSSRMLVVVVNDNGSGFDLDRIPAGPRECRGMAGMRERAAVVGGRLMVDSSPGRGTIVQARFELSKAAS